MSKPKGCKECQWHLDFYIEDEQVGDDKENTCPLIEIVRCKDCKYRDAEDGFCEGRGWPMQLVPDDGFCDKGERSEE